MFRWRIARKLTVASLLMIVLTIVAGGSGLGQVFLISQAIRQVLVHEQHLANSLELLAAGHRLIAALDHMTYTQNPLLASTEVAESLGTLHFYVDVVGQGQTDATLQAEMETTFAALDEAVYKVDRLARQENWPEVARILEQEVRPANEQMGHLLRQAVYQADQEMNRVARQSRAVVQQATLSLAVLVILTVVVAWGWRQFVFRGMASSIAELRRQVARVTQGDLSRRVEVRTGDEIEELATEFNKMAGDLAELIGTLEQRVAERTRDLERRSLQLEAATRVAREAAEILDLDRLLAEVVHLISDRFGFYHAGIFLVDEQGQYAVLRAASSEGGQRMLARGHQLRVGEVGVVGYVASRGEPRVALDVGEDAYYFDNPDLPLTRSEAALPLKIGGRIIGVLDVQSQEAAAFGPDEVATLQLLADQVAVAIERVRLVAQSRQALQELEMLYGQRVREAWRSRPGPAAYRYTPVGIEPLSSAPPAPIQPLQPQTVALGQDLEGRQLVVPIPVGNQVLGALALRRPPDLPPWSEQDLSLAQSLSVQVGLALEYARLLEETQRRAAQERLIAQVTARMRETLDVQKVLETAADELYQALDLERITIGLALEGGDESSGGERK